MRLYVNENEIATLKRALKRLACQEGIGSDDTCKAIDLYNRVELCEALQHNINAREVTTMTVRELVLLMNADERLILRGFDDGEVLETTPDEIINEYPILWCYKIEHVWLSRSLYKAIVIDLE